MSLKQSQQECEENRLMFANMMEMKALAVADITSDAVVQFDVLPACRECAKVGRSNFLYILTASQHILVCCHTSGFLPTIGYFP